MSPFRKIKTVLKSVANSKCLNVVTEYLTGRDGGYFVNIGANDGKEGDPIAQIIFENNSWRGLLIEPMKPAFEKLARNFSDRSRFTLVNSAVGETDGNLVLFFIDEDNCPLPLPAHASQLTSTNPKHITRHLGERYSNFITSTSVPAKSCDTIFHENEVTSIDAVLIDTEGFDFEVLKMFPFSKFKPGLLIFEHKHLKLSHKIQSLIMLHRLGYKISFDFDNAYCIQEI